MIKRIAILMLLMNSVSIKSKLIFSQQVNDYIKKAVPIRSISPNDENFSDLALIKEKIGNASVVVLGEISHTDGASFSAKTRLVKFLHKEMGFDVIAWEGGMLDAYYMNDALKHDSSIKSAKGYFMSGGWAASEYVNPLFEYAKNSWKTENPLIMAGFDVGRPPKGYTNANKIISEAYRECAIQFSESDKTTLDSLLRATYGFLGNIFTQKITVQSRKNGKYILQQLIDSSNIVSKDRNYFLRSIMMDVELENVRSITPESWNVMRDKYMYDRFMWLISHFYSGKKIIIWAASSHLIKNSESIERIEPKKNFADSIVILPQMGEYLSRFFADQLYTIAFTSYQGSTGVVYPEGHRFASSSFTNQIRIDGNSIEGEAHKLNKPYLFIDLKKNAKSGRNKFIAYPFGFSKDKAQWQQVIDAFFFIDKMFPDKVLKE